MRLKIKILLLILLSVIHNSFSQNDTINEYPKITTYNNDTVIVFSIAQGKELAFINEERKKLINTNRVNEKQLMVSDSIIRLKTDKIKNYEIVVDDFDTIIFEKDALIEICESEKELFNREIRKQKNMKIVFISTTVIVAVLGILF